MITPRRLAIFAAGLVALIAVGVGAGHLTADHGEHRAAEGGEPAHGAVDHGGHGAGGEPAAVRGLSARQDGLNLDMKTKSLEPGKPGELAFRIFDDRGSAIEEFDVEHAKRMHLILVRRDLTAFQHLHPELAGDGTWSVEATVEDPGTYRVFADFVHRGDAFTLADDLTVSGDGDFKELPPAGRTAVTDGGLDVALEAGELQAGRASQLEFSVARDGEPVETEPYLGAGGHLVALREGDLAFLHVHPEEGAGAIAFDATLPTPGAYRLFLQFQHEGRVETAAFTQDVAG